MGRAIMGAVVLCLMAAPTLGAARADGSAVSTRNPALSPPVPTRPATERARYETLWIFDADFEDLVGDNAGWTTEDRSGSLEYINYWHKDTIHRWTQDPEHPLGDSTWWCGTYDDCWRQPRGYGNEWLCVLRRSFPEVATLTDPGDPMFLEYDQRFAIESCYDYGYVDVSVSGDSTWTTLLSVSNEASCPGFEWPGRPKEWDSTWWYGPGHMVVDLSAYSGVEFELRFRFESDGVYSSQDSYDNWLHSVRDGAWQLDNIKLWAETPEPITIFLDDCESPGDNGWIRDDIPAHGQTGVVFERSYESIGGRSGWMMAAYDSTSGAMVDDQWSLLFSPPIDISDAPELVARWEGWFDLPATGDDYVGIYLSTGDDESCLWGTGLHGHTGPVWWLTSAGPEWIEVEDDWSEAVGDDWLGIRVWQSDTDPVANPHGKGMVLDRLRVGIPFATSIPDGEVLRDAVLAARPNPFGPRTTFEYSLASRSRVTIRVFDLAGRVVATLFAGERGPGEHAAVWDGTTDSGERAAGGVYFVRMEGAGDAGSFRETGKAVMLR
jgi:hypothetical protein